MKEYIFRVNRDSFSFINDTGESKGCWSNKWSHYGLLHRLINFLKSRGWNIENDKNVHKCIRKNFWYGRKGDLEFRLERYPRGFKFEFYQNIVFENPNGGRYDFNKFEKMPYLIKLLYLNETRHMKAFLKGLGCFDNTQIVYNLAEDKIKYNYVESCHHIQQSISEFKLSDLDGQTCKESYNHTDRNKKVIYNGEIKYFRDRLTGRLMRVIVYHNINNMWWAILNRYEYTNVADFELFDPTEDDFKVRRLRPDRKPKKYLEKVSKIKEASNKELLNELKRRGLKVGAL